MSRYFRYDWIIDVGLGEFVRQTSNVLGAGAVFAFGTFDHAHKLGCIINRENILAFIYPHQCFHATCVVQADRKPMKRKPATFARSKIRANAIRAISRKIKCDPANCARCVRNEVERRAGIGLGSPIAHRGLIEGASMSRQIGDHSTSTTSSGFPAVPHQRAIPEDPHARPSHYRSQLNRKNTIPIDTILARIYRFTLFVNPLAYRS
jgi:hypothetical protein